jgi:DNA-repair protein XRCC2
LREAGERQKAVAEARFECFVNEWGLDERLLRRLNGSNLEFRILNDGLLVEEKKGDKEDQD